MNINKFKTLYSSMINSNLIAIDIETWGLKPNYALQSWRCNTNEAGILCLAITNGDIATCNYDINFITSNINTSSIICGWNLKFDLSFLIASGFADCFQNKILLDGMLLLKRMQPKLPTYGLKQTLKQYAKFLDNIDVEYSKNIKFKLGNPSEYTTDELMMIYEYCNKDAYYTLQLINYLMSIARTEDINAAIIDSTVSYLFANSLYTGIPLNKTFIQSYSQNVEEKVKQLEIEFLQHDITPDILASTKKLREKLKTKGITLMDFTEKGELSTSKPALIKTIQNIDIKENKSLLDKIIKYKNINGERVKFLQHSLEALDKDNCVHPEPFLLSTYTGRLTYNISQTSLEKKILKNGKEIETKKSIFIGIPLHQMKRGEIRKMIVAPKGYKIVEIDFCNQEMRFLACIANEKTMLKFFETGEDLHAYTAAKIYNMNYEDFKKLKQTNILDYEQKRRVGKISNLALQYRLSADSLLTHWQIVHNLWDKTLNDAQIAKKTYLEIYPAIPQYWENAIIKSRHVGYAENLAKRRYPLQFLVENLWKDSQIAINFPIQSSGAEQKMLALYCLRKVIQKYDVKFAWDLHDGLYFYVRENTEFDNVLITMKKIIENLPYEKAWGWRSPINFTVEIKTGDDWGSLVEIKL